MKLNKVVFLDRDGVINQDSPFYVKNWDEFAFLPGSLEALNLLSRKGFELIVITNQSIINRGTVPLAVLEETHLRMRRAVARTGGLIRDIFFCPHRPDEACACRKPRPGLIERACRRYGIQPENSLMIGDSAKDILCGRRAGCGGTILVRTGNGPDAQQALAAQNILPDAVVDDLFHAAQLIVNGKIKPAALHSKAPPQAPASRSSGPDT
ncbi:MAG: D-glycero-beta-D-manno-heptose 1,7-bisphosphate 7-phosphatase [Desulfosarcinaceae bacterium]|jgi:D-glycero-D-manno-heptose 1,7-bisphosphate phosphatase